MEEYISVQTYWANIYVGLREGYEGKCHTRFEAEAVVQKYADEVGLGVTVTPTTFIYTRGFEPGVIVGLINYPRFPSTKERIQEHAFALAKKLKEAFKQNRVSIMLADETIMIGEK